MDLGVRGHNALVMGGSRGLGRAIAQAFAEEGMRVAISARDPDVLAAAAREIGASAYPAAYNRPGAVRGMIDAVLADAGHLDVLVVNSGGPSTGSATEATAVDWQRAFEDVWLPTTEAIRGALPGMIQRGYGRILVLTSLAAVEPEPGLVYSNSLRPGLHGLVNTLSREIAKHKVTVNALVPGYMNTQRVLEIQADPTEMHGRIPAGRYGEPHELAAMAVFLASPRASYITGQAIACDGGLLKSIY